jgi:hypothetical protein
MLDRCLGETWVSVGREFSFPQGLDFRVSPDPATNSPGVPFGEWTWQVNRHNEWPVCARTYAATKDEAYAKAVAKWLKRWLEQCPRPEEDLGGRQGPWRTIEIGIRLGSTWPQVISAFKDSEAFDDILWLAWLQSYAEQAGFVWEFRKTNNWLLMELNGLMHAGMQVHFHKDSETWCTNALDEFLRQLDIQFLDDGMQVELSTTYHNVCVSRYLAAVQVLQAGGHEVPDAFLKGIKKMIGAWHPLMKQDGVMFAFQDSGKMNLPLYLEKSISKTLWTDTDLWAINRKGSAPPLCSILPNAGYAVMRTGWKENDIAVAFDGGPFGDGHQHEDKLSIQIHAFGRDLIGEAGIVDYSDTPERHYCLTTLAHSTAIMDGHMQNRRENRIKGTMDLKADAGIEYDFESDTPWVKADYGFGYGPGRKIKVTHMRAVFLDSSSQVTVIDRFTARDNNEHTAEILFHVLCPEYDFNGSVLTTKQGYGNVALRVAKTTEGITPELTVVCGGTEPDLRGWADECVDRAARGYHWVEALPCLTIKVPFTGTSEIETKIEIFE